MKKAVCNLLAISMLFCLVLSGCSGSKSQDQEKSAGKSSTEQAKEAIKDFGKKPMDKARATQRLGVERTDAIDDAVKQ